MNTILNERFKVLSEWDSFRVVYDRVMHAWYFQRLENEESVLSSNVLSSVEIPEPVAERIKSVPRSLNHYSSLCHEANARWWHNPATGEPVERNIGEMLMLCVTELAEAMEGARKNLNDDKLPHRKMLEVELADCLIRIFDLADGLGLDIDGAFIEKMEYNRNRVDHTNEARLADGGKKW